jgi:lycopene beta-cyclase
MSAPAGRDREHYDIAIIGGGLAGLSLASRLAAPAFSRWKVLLIEPRETYSRDRTWSSWAVAEHAFSSARATRWQTWQVMRQLDQEDATGQARRLPLMTECAGAYAYEMVPADNFYRVAEERISMAPHITTKRGAAADAVSEHVDSLGNGHVAVQAGGTLIRAGLVFDGRPPTQLSDAAWMQHFRGGEIETDRPVFDTERATVMDFSVMTADDARAGRVHFIYVLPVSATRALIQDTFFVPAADTCADVNYEDNIHRYMARRFGVSDYRVVYPEGGAIPMDPQLRPSTQPARVLKIGTAGGMARASSGYAFFETQRACEAIANALARVGNIDQAFTLPRWRSDVSYWMDGVFLRVLRAHPALAPQIFANLFYRVPADVLARFLAGVGSRSDVLRVMMACPKLPFIRAALTL